MTTNELIINAILAIYFIMLLISILVAMMYYSNYLSAIDDKEYRFGFKAGSAFYVKGDFVFPINEKSEDNFTQKIIVQHKKAILFFWIWLLLLIPVIVICNFIN
jgi:hypothetical protein